MGTKWLKVVVLAVVVTAGFMLFWHLEQMQNVAQETITALQQPARPSEPALSAPDPVQSPAPPSSLEVPTTEPSAPAGEQTAQVPDPVVHPAGQQSAQAEAPAPAPVPGESTADTTGENAVEASEDVIKGTLNRGDTVSKLLEPHTDANNVQEIITATRRVFPLTSFRAGQPYVVVCDVQSGAVKRFEYEIDQKRRLVVEGQEGSPTPIARVEEIEYDTELSLVHARIDDNLFQAVADMGESPQLALLIANLFGWEINFIRDLQEGDSFSVLFEKLYRNGQFKGYGRTLGATFTNKGKTYEAFLFHDNKGREYHYNVRGENLRKVLLQAPLSFTRVTSGYTRSRKHPIFGDHRAHFGVDYGAPTGTPVKAVGDGVVTLRGWAGGYGNQVVVQHSAGLESMYSHLSGFARGIAKGSRVRQGQVIAFVGSTGNSTGPHLDFRLKQQGKFVNPTKAVNPRSEAVGKISMAAYQQRMQLVRQFMNGEKPVSAYTPELMAAPHPSRLPAVTAEKTDKEAGQEKEKPQKKTTTKKTKRKTRSRQKAQNSDDA